MFVFVVPLTPPPKKNQNLAAKQLSRVYCAGSAGAAAGEDQELQEADRGGRGDSRSQPGQIQAGSPNVEIIKYLK